MSGFPKARVMQYCFARHSTCDEEEKQEEEDEEKQEEEQEKEEEEWDEGADGEEDEEEDEDEPVNQATTTYSRWPQWPITVLPTGDLCVCRRHLKGNLEDLRQRRPCTQNKSKNKMRH